MGGVKALTKKSQIGSFVGWDCGILCRGVGKLLDFDGDFAIVEMSDGKVEFIHLNFGECLLLD